MEETKRRRFIIRAVLEGEVDVQDEPVPGVLYPLTDGVYETANGEYRFTVTDGHHVKCEVIRSGSATTHFAILNCYSGELSISNAACVNNKPEVFALEAAKEAELKVSNLVNDNNGGAHILEFNVLLRNANGTTSYMDITQAQHTSDVTVTKVPESDTPIGAIGFGVNGRVYAQGAYAEFDIYLTSGDDVLVG